MRFTGSIQRDDTGEVQAVEAGCTRTPQRSRFRRVENRREQHHQSQQHQLYAKLTINGEVLYEVDVINMIEIVDGVDLMEEHRNAIGL